MISDRLKRIILRELGLDDWQFTAETTAAMVPGWDSLNHARVIAAVEDAYGIRFATRDIIRLETVAQLQALVDQKTTG
jgi:acyl carrier protein